MDIYNKDDDDKSEEFVVRGILSVYVDKHATTPHFRILALAGEYWVQDVLTGNPQRCQEQFCMSAPIFAALKKWTYENTDIQNSRNQQGISVAQKLAIFLWIAGRGASIKDAQEQFHHSGSIISRCFHEGLEACCQLHAYTVHQSSLDAPLHPRIANNTKYNEYFKDCVGALDGIHIAASVPATQAPAYRNRKGCLSQNVLAVYNFNLEFTYVLAGWGGSARDSRVLEDAITRGGMQVPRGKYLLADAGYSNTDFVLTPYRGVRYNKEQAAPDFTPGNKEELFNLRHSSLRNAIEQTFGLYKLRFRCSDRAPESPLTAQVKMIFVLTAVHNWIGQHAVDKDMYEQQEEIGADDRMKAQPMMIMTKEKRLQMDQMRDAMATKMWDDYLRHTGSGQS